ncbi:MAG: hypothetical protein GTO45_29960 [Candidatus Aminicenantes bacterium]|nr:hypothetical protein [Candidatus Aminicenantes bacterium]NIM83009.1 hypothetical protein [Candidatus Aminicenantes bacterium]NIN22395.1 hypothetical protein [Candidatus Aminicenantes bacterium]NIN46163.1 hypothetical protein [Candidatus Aminicenantes bacterium]NIN89001.1 hypothetical protein [Candidatus Aminicenantes bacterium]
MKKIIILLVIVLLVVTVFGFGDKQQSEKPKQKTVHQDVVTKTYVLKHISPDVAHKTLRLYFWESYYDRNGKMFTVKIPKENIATFEKLLKQLDVERKKILIRIFTVIASREGKGGPIDNKDLRQVLNELQKVLSFKSFRLDGISAVTVTDGQRHSRLFLSSQVPLELRLEDIYIREGKDGKQTVGFEFRLQKEVASYVRDGKLIDNDQTLIESQTSVKENGYLVAGVSRLGNGDSLVLVINAEIKE